MSLSSLLDKLSGLLSKSFIFAAFLPTLMATFMNGLLLYLHQPWFRGWFNSELKGSNAFTVTTAAVALTIVAYMLSSVSVYLQEVLEGKHALPMWVREQMSVGQQKRLDDLWAERVQARDNHLDIKEDQEKWKKLLSDAASSGVATGIASLGAFQPQFNIVDAFLKIKRAEAKAPTYAELEGIVTNLSQVLAGVSIQLNPEVAQAKNDLSKVINTAARIWEASEAKAINKIQSSFGGFDYVAPTAMGNVAESMQNYAMSHYGMNLERFWTRFQFVLQGEKDYYGALQDAKTQLDFLVASCWLVTFTWVGWVVALSFFDLRPNLWVYLAVALGGPLLSRLFYGLAVTNYSSLSNLIGSGVDLYRFSLLRKLHAAMPPGLRQERRIWHALQSATADDEFSYASEEKEKEKEKS
jgi:hypothetical protein